MLRTGTTSPKSTWSKRPRNQSPGPPDDLRTLTEVARWRAEWHPDETVFTFLADGESEAGLLTYGDLDGRARAIAAELIARGGRGERVLLQVPPGLDFLAAIFGCLYAGAIAVPVSPPELLRLNRVLPRLQAVARDAQAKFVLGTREVLAYLEQGFTGDAQAELICLEDLRQAADVAPLPDGSDPSRVALLQYTSGSTGSPRGIVLTHANLMYSLRAMYREDVDSAVGVHWLPPYHDFGLVGGALLPVYAGRPTVFMSPLAFIERPIRWLLAISRYRGTTSGGPNFAFEMCVRKMRPAECEGLDLSSWKIAVVGAEPVRAETIDRFTDAFRPYGFRRETFLPGYGLAEAVLNVTSGRWYEPPVVRSFSAQGLHELRAEEAEEDDPGARRLVGCGRAWPEQHVTIVDPRGHHELPPGRIGEIWVQSPNVGQGYWNRPEETERTFRARLNGNDGKYLRTGDLGFLSQGELFVVGRLKELIILGGRNYYPHDLEQVVRRGHATLGSCDGVAFSCDVDGEERLVIVQEVRRTRACDFDTVMAGIRRELAEEYLLTPYAVVLVAGGTVPKTASGKPRRRECRAMFLEGRLRALAEWRAECVPPCRRVEEYVAPRSPLEQEIAAVWAEVLRVERVGVHDNFFALGGSSLLAMEVYVRLRHLVPGELPLARLFERPTVAELAAAILAAQAQQNDPAEVADLLDRLESMPEEEARRLRGEPGQPGG